MHPIPLPLGPHASLHDDDAVEGEVAPQVEVSIHEQDSLTHASGLDVGVAGNVDDGEPFGAGRSRVFGIAIVRFWTSQLWEPVRSTPQLTIANSHILPVSRDR